MKHGDTVWSAQFSSDGKRIVTASGFDAARVWDAATGKSLTEVLNRTDTDEQIHSAQFSPDGKRFVTATGMGPLRG